VIDPTLGSFFFFFFSVAFHNPRETFIYYPSISDDGDIMYGVTTT